jgi:uncharacterized membrane protein YdbT with pleckstrin-like domain
MIRSRAPEDPQRHERVFFHGHPCWRATFGYYVKGTALAVAAGAIAGLLTGVTSDHVQVGWVVAVVLIVFAVVLLRGHLSRLGTTYTITSERLTIRKGLLSRELHETRLDRIQNVNCRQSILERLLRVGTVDFDTAGGAEYDFAFRGVANPRQIVRTVDGALRAGFRPEDEAPGVSAWREL